MAGRLEGKTAFVTAAGQGIGRGVALAYAAEGARVFATDINEETLATLPDEAKGDLTAFRMDVRDAEAVKAGITQADPDILFNAAGFVHHGTILDASDEQTLPR